MREEKFAGLYDELRRRAAGPTRLLLVTWALLTLAELANVAPSEPVLSMGIPASVSLLAILVLLLAPGVIRRKVLAEEGSREERMAGLMREARAIFGLLAGLALLVTLLAFLARAMMWAHLFVTMTLLLLLFHFPRRERVRADLGLSE